MKSSSTGGVSPGREARRLSTLLEVSQALSGTLNIKSAFHRVLEILGKHHGAVRSLIVLLDEDTHDLRVEAADGLAKSDMKIRYDIGDRVTLLETRCACGSPMPALRVEGRADEPVRGPG